MLAMTPEISEGMPLGKSLANVTNPYGMNRQLSHCKRSCHLSLRLCCNPPFIPTPVPTRPLSWQQALAATWLPLTDRCGGKPWERQAAVSAHQGRLVQPLGLAAF